MKPRCAADKLSITRKGNAGSFVQPLPAVVRIYQFSEPLPRYGMWQTSNVRGGLVDLHEPWNRIRVVNVMRPIRLVPPCSRGRQPERLVDSSSKIFWLLRIGGRVSANLV